MSQVLKVGACSSDSDISEICGHRIEGKFPTNLNSKIVKKDTEEQEKKVKREDEKQKASLKVSHQMTLVQSLQSGSTHAKTHQRFMAITRKLAIFGHNRALFFVEGSSKPLRDVGCASSTPTLL